MTDKLTLAEQAVLVELVSGAANHTDIAKRLGVSRQTVNNRLMNMYQKTGTTNQVQLLRWAFREAQRIVKVADRATPHQQDPIRIAAQYGLRIFVLEYKP